MHHRILRSLHIAYLLLVTAALLVAAVPLSATAQSAIPDSELTAASQPALAPTAPAAVADERQSVPLPRSLVLKIDRVDSGRFFPAEAFAGREIPTFLTPPPTAGRLPVETVEGPTSFEMPADDPWLSFDKIQHFTFSFLIAVGCQYGLVNKLSVSEHRALPLSITTSATVGLTKEYYDLRYGPRRTFSKRDLVANAAGIVVAAGFILL